MLFCKFMLERHVIEEEERVDTGERRERSCNGRE